MIFYLLLSFFLMATTRPDTFVVQTEDGTIYFVTDIIQSFNILKPIRYYNDHFHYNGFWEFNHEIKKVDVDNGFFNESGIKIRNPETEGELSSDVRPVNKLDYFRVTNDTLLSYGKQSFYLDELIFNPIIVDGIYVSACSDNVPSMINNTLFIISHFKIFLFDLKHLHSKTIKLDKIFHLQNFKMNLQIKESLDSGTVIYTILLNNKTWSFSQGIKAIYIIKKERGINCLLKVVTNDAVERAYVPRREKEKQSYSYIYYVIFMSTLGFVLYRSRNLKYRKPILKSQNLYSGLFLKKECFIKKFQKEWNCAYFELKHPNLIENYSFVFPTLIFERSNQFVYGDSKDSIKVLVDALQYIHSKKLHHGRICPENIRIVRGGPPKTDTVKIANIFPNNGWRSYEQIKSEMKKKKISDIDNLRSDIFAIGCLIHYYLTGYHPFDTDGLKQETEKSSKHNKTNSTEKHENTNSTTNDSSIYLNQILMSKKINDIETNIVLGVYKIRSNVQIEHDFIYHCIKRTAKIDFDLSCHPYFWDSDKTIDFICEFSDFIESNPHLKKRIERAKKVVFDEDWTVGLDQEVFANLYGRKQYDFTSLVSLVRVVRNCHRHYREVKNKAFFDGFGGIGGYFNYKFPSLLMFLYRSPAIKELPDFNKYFRNNK